MYADVSLGASAENSRLCEGIYGIEEFHGGDSDVVWPCYFGNWSFAEGVPREGWKKDRGASVPFKLDGCINLDVLCSRAPAEKGAEGVVYVDYAVENDGVAFLGIGCNWGFELFCDGVKVATTLPDGNGSTYVFATNHRLFFHVTKGTHLLAFHVFRGEEHWNFAASAGLTVQAPPDPRLAYGIGAVMPSTTGVRPVRASWFRRWQCFYLLNRNNEFVKMFLAWNALLISRSVCSMRMNVVNSLRPSCLYGSR